jgi:histidine triad (HIT) family protein
VPTQSEMKDCIFCQIVAGQRPASLIFESELTLAFVDLRQHNAGHALVIPRAHLHDVRDLDDVTGAALMATVTRVSRAVTAAFKCDGLTLWHSVDEAGGQEVPHLHIHIHPRWTDDKLFALYPSAPPTPDRTTLDDYAKLIREKL